MQHTFAGLPNTCALCGQPIDPEIGWWAENEDVARSGGGVCGKHISPAGLEIYVSESGQAEPQPGVSADNASTVGGTAAQTDVIVVAQDADGKPERLAHAKRAPGKKQAK